MFFRLAIACVAVSLWPTWAWSVTLQSHVGVYELSLSKNRSDSGISGVSGRLVLRILESCEGYTQSQRMILVTTGADGKEIVRDFNFESTESRDGTGIQFDSSDTANGALQSHHVGRAELAAKGGEGKVVFSKPEMADIPLESGTIFPTEHFIALIEAARDGRPSIERRVYDGSGPNGIYDAVAQISEPATATRDQAVAAQLTDGHAWNVHLAYFKPATEDFLPEYEIGFRLHENGVASDLELDYGTFALKASLSRLDFLPGSCDGGSRP
ncbi:MAG: DUF1849 family protein [Alphaproteobacteria bacterium]|nr:DUF1849 family protein [Alphaproteobacteria bacterium]